MKTVYLSSFALILGNLYPIYGVLYLNWNLNYILFLYLIENLLIGLFILLKIVFLKNFNNYNNFRFLFEIIDKTVTLIGFMFVCIFLNGIYFLFLNVLLLKENFKLVDASSFNSFFSFDFSIWTLLPFFVSHLISFILNYLIGGEYKKSDLYTIIDSYSPRVINMHLTVIFGGLILILTGLDKDYLLLITLVFFKIISDLRSHIREHSIT